MKRSRGRRFGSDRGETLVEVLAAVVILGIAGVAVMAGLLLSVKASDIHRKETASGAYVKNYAEAIQNYVQGHQSAFSCSPDYSPATVGFTASSVFVASYSWSALGPTGAATACTANASQLIKLKVVSTDGRATERLSFVLRKPCSDDQAVAATKCT